MSITALPRVLTTRPHVLRYAVVGLVCTAFQLLVFAGLHRLMPAEVANAAAFIISTQLNFLLSYRWTWAARLAGANDTRRIAVRRLVGFNLAASAGLLINSGAFIALFRLLHLAANLSAPLAVTVSTCASYVLGSKFVFAAPKAMPAKAMPSQAMPSQAIDLRDRPTERRLAAPGTAFFLPAHNEAQNLPLVVEEAIAYLRSRTEPFAVIIVDDGSTDDTAATAQALQEAFPGIVEVIRHEQNRGYGAALRSGFEAALRTGLGWVAFCDSDRQFKPADLKKLTDAAESGGADIAIGYRLERADNFKRRLMGRGWHLLSRLVLGFKALDVDCGFKLFSREALLDLQPQLAGDHATVSPEILARAHRAGYKVVEVGLDHYPRGHGEQSGANVRVVVESLRELVQVRRQLQQVPVTARAAQLADPATSSPSWRETA